MSVAEIEAAANVLQEQIAIRYTREFLLKLSKAALEAAERVRTLAPYPGCMAPDGGEACPQYTAAIARIKELEAQLNHIRQQGWDYEV